MSVMDSIEERYDQQIADLKREFRLEVAGHHMAEERVKQLEQEIAALKKWVNDLQSRMYINCVYCGHRYGPDPGTPIAMADVLKEHIEKCPKHPLSEARRQIAALKAEVEKRDNLIALQGMQLEQISNILNGEAVCDFALSFPLLSRVECMVQMKNGLRENKLYLENDLALKMQEIAALNTIRGKMDSDMVQKMEIIVEQEEEIAALKAEIAWSVERREERDKRDKVLRETITVLKSEEETKECQMSRCCCGKYDVSQDKDFLMNDTQHQMLGKDQNYIPFCGPKQRHLLYSLQASLTEKDKQIVALKAEVEKYYKKSCAWQSNCEERDREIIALKAEVEKYKAF